MISIGDVLTLELKHSEQIEKYRCKLVERTEDDLYIDYPINIETNRTVFLLDGTQLKVSFIGKDGSLYLFETEIRGRIKQNIPMLILSFPGKDQLIKIQRRQYVRVETEMDIAVYPLNEEFLPFTAYTDDISAGGAAVIVPKSIHLNDSMNVKTWLVFPMQNGEYQYLQVLSKVVRTIDVSNASNKISLEFIGLTENDRQLIMRFCFERQLGLKKKMS